MVLADGSTGRAAVPSGASTGAHEAVELRDGDPTRFHGKGVRTAVAAVNGEIADAVVGLDAEDQALIDETMIALDGTEEQGRLGANAILGVSLATAKAAAPAHRQPLYRYVGGVGARLLPVPMMNIVNGGAHADNPLDFQEFMIAPVGAPTFAEAVRMGVGGLPHPARRPWQRPGTTPTSATRAASRRTSPTPTRRCDSCCEPSRTPATSPAPTSRSASTRPARSSSATASTTTSARGATRTVEEHVDYLLDLVAPVPDQSPSRTRWPRTTSTGWQRLTARLGERVQLVGDDVFCTDVDRLRDGIDGGYANSILVKVNQIGTLTETLATVDAAHKAGYRVVMSHRSGETEDTTIADLAVGDGCGQIKTGSLSRSDRTAKYNQLIRIEEELGDRAVYAGSR